VSADGRESREAVSPGPLDAYPPAQIARLVEAVGVRKAGLPASQTLLLGVLAGAFIAFGASLYIVVITDSTLGYGPTRLVGGLAFSLGLILVIVGGSELFTGNSLIVMGWADRKISTAALLRNWGLVYVANLAGAVATAFFVAWSGVLDGNPAVTSTAIRVAEAKAALGLSTAFLRGILCNALVCLAVWLCFAAHSVTDKILAIPLPIAAFVALGFEHSVANMFFLPLGWMLGSARIDLASIIGNLIPVTLGNIVGGGLLVAGVYWAVYLRGSPRP
jgi:formate transporter